MDTGSSGPAAETPRDRAPNPADAAIPTWQITRRQWVVVGLIALGIIAASTSYVAFNHAPGPERWPAYWAWDPATQSLAQPATGPGAYQTFILKSWLDEKIPFVPILAVPYISFLVIVPILTPLLTLGVSAFRRFLTVGVALIVSQFVLDVGYWLFQTNTIRDVDAGGGVAGYLVETVWGTDHPFNGFPSGHCAWSVVAICALFRLRHVMPRTAWILILWLMLVFPATVMLRQHYLIDVYAGIFIGFAVYWGVMFLLERPRLAPRTPDMLDQALARV